MLPSHTYPFLYILAILLLFIIIINRVIYCRTYNNPEQPGIAESIYPAKASGENCKLSVLRLEQRLSWNVIHCILVFKSDIWQQQFNDFLRMNLSNFEILNIKIKWAPITR